jgi:hypothetical protein
MQVPANTKSTLWGVAGGAVACAIVDFRWAAG